jgi:hypothetical protein
LRLPWKYLKVRGTTTDISNEMEVREGIGMSRSQLDAYGEGEAIWGFVAQLGADRFTGQANVGVGARVHLYATEGHVYFAERDGDAQLESRFVSMGVLTQEQLDAGVVRLGDGVSLARLFSREPSIDRDSVELALEMMTAQTMESVAMDAVGAVELFPLRHHSTGIHQWKPLPIAEPVPFAHGIAADLDEPAVAELVAPAMEPEPSPVTRSVPQTGSVPIADPSTLPTLGAWNPPSVEERLKTSEHRYAPMSDFSGLNLPKLASRPMSVNEITAAQAAPPAAVQPPATAPGDDLASLVQRITDDDLADPVPSMEQEAAFTSASAPPLPSTDVAAADPEPVLVNAGTLVDAAALTATTADTLQPVHASAFANLPPLTREPPSTLVTSTFAQIVKTPASNPTVEQGMDLEALFAAPPAPPRPAHEVPFSTSSWEPPVSPQATAEEIWGLVDDMVGADAQDESLAAAGSAGEKKPRVWRRGKKG